MNKKFMSLVLAAVFTISLGSNGFTNPYSYTGGTSSGNNGTINVSMDDLENKMETGKINRSGGTSIDNIAGATETTNRICAVFNYAAGVVLSVMDADRNITLYNNGNPFISLGYNEDGSFTVTGVTIQGTDLARVEAAGGLKSFLLALGVPETALKQSTPDADGDNVTVSSSDVAWLAQAEEQLRKGINHSISISLTGSYGASVTYLENGKQLETIAYDGTQIAQYNYNAAGTLESISQISFEVDSLGSTGSDADKRINSATYEEKRTVVHLDEFGKQSYVTDANGNITTQYTYSSNGSIASVYDATTESTTYYTGGHAAYVINDQGFKTAEYFYHENGSLDGVKSYNYDEDTGKVTTTTITAYRWGKAVGSADLSSGTGVKTFDELRSAVDYIKAHPDAAKADLISGAAGKTDASNSSIFGNITSISLYTADLNNSGLMNFLGIAASDITAMRAMSNGYSMVGQAAITIDTIAYGTDEIDGGTNTEAFTANTEIGDSGKSKGAFLRSSTSSSSETTREGVVGEQMSVKLTVMNHGGQAYQAICTPTTLRDAINQQITNTTTVTNQYSADPVITGSLVTEQSDLQKIADTLKTDDNNVKIEDGVIVVTDKDGNVTKYAAVKDGQINMMEGSGFTSMDGETMLVDISDLSDSAIADMKSAGTVMFMGNVAYTESGQLAIAMDKTYGGGYRFGEADVSAEVDRIIGVANGSIAPAADGSDNWILQNTEENIAKLGRNFMNETSGSISDKLEEAWRLLF